MKRKGEYKEMKKIKNNKGITLVALIITIIVLLILAVVAISAVNGDGIISKAKLARKNYQEAQEEENLTLAGHLAQIEENANNGGEEEFTRYGKTFINNSKTSTKTIVKEGEKTYCYIIYFKSANFTNCDVTDKVELTQLNIDENMELIESWLDFHSDDFILTIDNVAPICFIWTSTIDSQDIEEKDFIFFSKDCTRIVEDDNPNRDMEIGVFDYQSYFN